MKASPAVQIPNQMHAVVTTGNGGYDKLDYRLMPTPVPAAGEVLVRVLAAGMNNTEINTRLGWYSSSVAGSTDDLSTAQQDSAEHKDDGGWNEATPFPIIQGTDCCGRVVAAGHGGDEMLFGKRVLVRAVHPVRAHIQLRQCAVLAQPLRQRRHKAPPVLALAVFLGCCWLRFPATIVR